MVKINVVARDGSENVVEGLDGQPIMEAIRASNIEDVITLCGGFCACAMCHVYVDAPWVDIIPRMDDDENGLLDSSVYRRPNSRLSCQIRLSPKLVGARITIAPEPE